MKAYEITEFGFAGLKLVQRDAPVPKRGQVLLKMTAASLNFRDLLVVRGLYNPRMTLPATLGSDGVGEVIAVGDGVTSVSIGDRVAVTFFENWDDGELTEEGAKSTHGAGRSGVLAELVCVDQTGVVRLPEHLTDVEAATLPCAALTAWNALFEQAQLRPGETVLALGTGGVSLFALQFATTAGARVIITSSSNEKLAQAEGLGAAGLVNYRESPDWEKNVRELTGGRGVDHVIEVGGAGTLAKSLRAVRRGGTISLIGVLTGAGSVDPMPILMNGIRVNGIFVGSRAMFRSMNRAISQHQLRPVVDRVFDFDDVPSAFQFMETGQHFGKIGIQF